MRVRPTVQGGKNQAAEETGIQTVREGQIAGGFPALNPMLAREPQVRGSLAS